MWRMDASLNAIKSAKKHKQNNDKAKVCMSPSFILECVAFVSGIWHNFVAIFFLAIVPTLVVCTQKASDNQCEQSAFGYPFAVKPGGSSFCILRRIQQTCILLENVPGVAPKFLAL